MKVLLNRDIILGKYIKIVGFIIQEQLKINGD